MANVGLYNSDLTYEQRAELRKKRREGERDMTKQPVSRTRGRRVGGYGGVGRMTAVHVCSGWSRTHGAWQPSPVRERERWVYS